MIEFSDVTKRYPDGTLAVERVDIVIKPHTTTVLVGSSGSGKTTLLRMINRAFERSIDGHAEYLTEARSLVRSYLFEHVGTPLAASNAA